MSKLFFILIFIDKYDIHAYFSNINLIKIYRIYVFVCYKI